MSQIGQILDINPATLVETLTGNIGGPVPPTGNNIFVIGDGATVTVSGNPATSTLTISAGPGLATEYDEDVGSAAPLLGHLSIKGATSVGGTATNINTIGSGNIVSICLNNSISQPNTNSAATAGMYSLGGNTFLHNYGTNNTFLGRLAGNLTLTILSATQNTGIGFLSLESLTTGSSNVAIGGALSSVTTGSNNVGEGVSCLTNLTTGNYNTSIGFSSGVNLVSGAYNIFIGESAGSNYNTSESSNILLLNAGTAAESNVIRIGTQGGGNGQQNAAYMAGIYNIAVNATNQVTLVDLNGKLGSSRGNDGQVLIGQTGGTGSPAWANLTAGVGITITNGANSITIAASGSTTLNYTNVNHAASPYTVVSTDEYISVDCSAGVVSLLFPNAATSGRTYVVKDRTGNAQTNNISVTTVGGAVNIDGVTTYTMNTKYSSIELMGNGTSFEIF
jgi:hypothetical protein